MVRIQGKSLQVMILKRFFWFFTHMYALFAAPKCIRFDNNRVFSIGNTYLRWSSKCLSLHVVPAYLIVSSVSWSFPASSTDITFFLGSKPSLFRTLSCVSHFFCVPKRKYTIQQQSRRYHEDTVWFIVAWWNFFAKGWHVKSTVVASSPAKRLEREPRPVAPHDDDIY